MNYRIFVYGTLRAGGSLHFMLRHQSALVGAGVLLGARMYTASGAIPYVTREGDEMDRVWGEVYEVGERLRRELDAIEGHPHNYQRTPVRILLDDNSTTDAEAYLVDRETVAGLRPVPGGNWLLAGRLLR